MTKGPGGPDVPAAPNRTIDGGGSAGLAPTMCERCGTVAGARAWDVQIWSPDRLWLGWALCELCCAMVENAIVLELAGAGPGGHREVARDPDPLPYPPVDYRKPDEGPWAAEDD